MSQSPETLREIITWSILKLKRRMKSEPAMHANIGKSMIQWAETPPLRSYQYEQFSNNVETSWFLRRKLWLFHTYNGFHGCCCVIQETSGTVGCGGKGGMAYIGRITSSYRTVQPAGYYTGWSNVWCAHVTQATTLLLWPETLSSTCLFRSRHRRDNQ